MKLIFLTLAVLALAACDNDYQAPDEVPINVYFYYPDGSPEYLGQTIGVPSCRDMAHGYATDQNLLEDRQWNYICCTIEDGWTCNRQLK